MQRKILVAFSLVLLFACKQNSFTEDHLRPQVMQKVLLDISIAEAYSFNMKDSTHRNMAKNTDTLTSFYKTIFSHYKITPEEFSNSLEWYKSHPAELDTIYNKLVPVAIHWQAADMAVKVKADSLANVAKLDSLAKIKADTTAISKVENKLVHVKKSKVDTAKKAPTLTNKKIATSPKIFPILTVAMHCLFFPLPP